MQWMVEWGGTAVRVDRTGFDEAMAQQKTAARAAWKGSGQSASEEVWFDIADREGSTEFTGYSSTTGEGEVIALVRDGVEVECVAEDALRVGYVPRTGLIGTPYEFVSPSAFETCAENKPCLYLCRNP